ncbi:aflatoxin B1-aldehyde reductase [Myxozyma melibiosi]|uniref:Aflatoxin B1-aldehyde reductase n=1 Tax=Myxozyma melibiosi TaxID=54550 RepID=A0ABR1FFJ5_9ASCO
MACRVILGMMTFGPPSSVTARITTIEATKEIFSYLKQKGYNEIDTARVYTDGLQEAFSAEAGYKTEFGFDTATKMYPNNGGEHSAANLPTYVNKSLSELKTDCVEIFYLHAADRTVPLLETLQTTDKLYKEGKFKMLGISNYTAYEVAEIMTLCKVYNLVRPKIYQGRYNCVTRDVEEELFPALRHYGLDFVCYNPIAGGLLSGKYNKAVDVPSEGRFSSNRQGSLYRTRYFRDVYWDALDMIQPVAEKHNLTVFEVALRWMVHHSALKLGPAKGQTGDGIIIGVSSLEQLKSNLAAIESGPLPDEVVAVLDKAAKHVRSDSPHYWHGELNYSYKWE